MSLSFLNNAHRRYYFKSNAASILSGQLKIVFFQKKRAIIERILTHQHPAITYE